MTSNLRRPSLFLLAALLITSPFFFSSSSSVSATQVYAESQASELLEGFHLSAGDSKTPSTKDSRMPSAVQNSAERSVMNLSQNAGHYKLPRSRAASMFYFFFESKNNKTKDPVVLWLTGGPGCSGSTALFYENGPFKITDNLSLEQNEFGWDKASNILFVDQPIGTGFSTSLDERDTQYNEDGISNDLYDFLQAFFAEHSQFVNNDFFIIGESYAGHYIPALAARVQKANKAKEGIHINLKGIAVGNGLTNPEIQYESLAEYALSTGRISKVDYEALKQMFPQCQQQLKLCAADNGGESACKAAYDACIPFYINVSSMVLQRDNLNRYDIRKQCIGKMCYDLSNMEKFLNQAAVKAALGVGNVNFVSCSISVYKGLIGDYMKNQTVSIPELLEDGIKLLVYAGEYDLTCNWIGNERWVDALLWAGQREYRLAPFVPFTTAGTRGGEVKSYGPLTFFKVYNAGHMVPMDQPAVALEMLRRWTLGNLV
ncbi:serine carboxypeptidase-like [Malania oleifera]|uniref:serine carboxypeptidase-like n=1 Tax=Malania oleifera TaxID=397392 RepID=UPI0025AE872E|nr:serine carboxypeptidase-like [Malania oleifera]